MNTAPIALFVYNRPEHTRKTIEALSKNLLALETDLFIFSDGWKDEISKKQVEEVRSYIRTISGFKSIHISEQQTNHGLAHSIIGGVSEIVNRFGKVIVLEDDIVTSPYFLEYMNTALDMYQNDAQVASISGYMYPVKANLPDIFFLGLTSSWGWATWKRAWDMFELDGAKLLGQIEKQNLSKKFDIDGSYGYTAMLKRQIAGLNNSWAIRWYASMFLKNMFTLYPDQSLVQNIGFDGSGTHSSISNVFANQLVDTKIVLEKTEMTEHRQARMALENYFESKKPTIMTRIVRKIKTLLKYNV